MTEKRLYEKRGLFRELLRYCMPLVIANLLQSFYSLTDFFLTGIFVGDAGLSAVSNGGQVMALYTGIIIGLSNGGNVLVGQFMGGNKKQECGQCAGNFLTLFSVLGILSVLVMFKFSEIIMRFMKAPVLDMSSTYLACCAPGALAIAGYNAAAATLRGIGDSKRPLIFVAVSVGINIFLDVLFMYVFRMGVVGAAIATVTSQYIAFIIAGICFLLFQKTHLRIGWTDFVPDKKYMVPILKIGFPCAVQMTVASVSWLSVTVLLNHYGVIVSAAYGASAKIKDMVQTVSGAISMAATAMIAQALGGRQYDRALSVMYLAMKLAVGFSIVNILVVELFAPHLIGLFTDRSEIIVAGVKNLRIEIIGQVFYAVFMIYHSMMTGAGHTKMVLFSSFVNCILVRTVLAEILSNIPNLGATGVYLACMLAPSASIPIGVAYICKGSWKKRVI